MRVLRAQACIGDTDMFYRAPTPLKKHFAVKDEAGPSVLLAAAMLHSYGIRTSQVKWQEYEPEIERYRTHLYALFIQNSVRFSQTLPSFSSVGRLFL